MGFLPFNRGVVLRLLILLAVPIAPLILTMFPIEVLFQQLIKIVF